MSTLSFLSLKRSSLWTLTAAALFSVACSSGDDDPLNQGKDDSPVPSCDDPALCDTGVQLSPEQARMTCEDSQIGGRLLRRLTQGEVQATLLDIFPQLEGRWAGTRLSADGSSKLGFTNDAAALVVGGTTARELQKTAEEVAAVVTSPDVLSNLLPCSRSGPEASCAGEFLEKYGYRIFRRPLKEEEKKSYVDFHEKVAARSDFHTGLKWSLSSMLQSPHALYRTEVGEETKEGIRLTQYELATQLAYIFTGSTPDETLLQAAAEGELSDTAALRSHAVRLLETSPRRYEAMRAFFLEWLQYSRALGRSRDKMPSFAEEITPRLVEETRFFLDTLVFGDKGNVSDLMKANFTAVDQTLAQFYGFGESSGDWTRVDRPEEHGQGILAQGSLLVMTAHQQHTSPTLRGLLFYERFLCNSKPPVPAFVPSIEETSGGTEAKTTREKYEEHHAQGACATCHKQFEPFGYNFEQFDELGRYRSDEEGHPINTVSTGVLPDGSDIELTDLNSLSTLVDETDDIENCVSGLMASYFFSGSGGQSCVAEPQRRALASGDMSLLDFYLSLIEAPHFTRRQ